MITNNCVTSFSISLQIKTDQNRKQMPKWNFLKFALIGTILPGAVAPNLYFKTFHELCRSYPYTRLFNLLLNACLCNQTL